MKKGIKFLLQHSCAGLFLDPGLGKTGITLAAFRILRNEGLVRRMLVVAPRRPAHRVWPREVAKWKEFSEYSVRVLHGRHKDEYFAEKADIDVVTLEGLHWLLQKTRKLKRGSAWPWDMLVVDESSKFKNTNTDRFNNLKPLLSRFKRRVILTGSPATNGLMNLFGQVYILDMGSALGAYITHFRNEYFNPAGFGGYSWRIQEGAEERIYRKIAPLVLRMSAEDYLELPPIMYHNIDVELPPEARATYDKMEDELFTLVDGGRVTAANAGVATGKCRQIANGGVFDADKKVRHVHDAKTDALEDLIEELSGKPVMVAYEFLPDLERLRKRFGQDLPYIGGGLSDAKQAVVEDLWNAGKIPILAAQADTAAHGLNLQDAPDSYLVFYSMLWDLEVYEQLIRRLHRKGRKSRVHVYHLLASDTVDAVQLHALRRKDRTQQALLRALADYRAGKRH